MHPILKIRFYTELYSVRWIQVKTGWEDDANPRKNSLDLLHSPHCLHGNLKPPQNRWTPRVLRIVQPLHPSHKCQQFLGSFCASSCLFSADWNVVSWKALLLTSTPPNILTGWGEGSIDINKGVRFPSKVSKCPSLHCLPWSKRSAGGVLSPRSLHHCKTDLKNPYHPNFHHSYQLLQPVTKSSNDYWGDDITDT